MFKNIARIKQFIRTLYLFTLIKCASFLSLVLCPVKSKNVIENKNVHPQFSYMTVEDVKHMGKPPVI